MKKKIIFIAMTFAIVVFGCISAYAGCGAGTGTLFTYPGSWIPFDNDSAEANTYCYWHSIPGNQYYADNYAYARVTIEWIQNGQVGTRSSTVSGTDICGLLWTNRVWADNDDASATSYHQVNCYYCGDSFYGSLYDPDV